ncbi:YraN family protein [Acinetobacter sp. ANC 5054]|uniref:YraN family protein n=1 Tax=Acinetobacter sp. ANC 5054 TaxID=1977877 RepID=UPI000A351E18|nr:YraN family protein [Acinetobacter sp. ANC 5054]OTG78470.1 YraN family protein [Acinetobacter sp. ANC 5054]
MANLGQWAEQQARAWAEKLGYRTVRVNFHSRYGEIDLIVEREQDLLFIEVKARSITQYAHANETVSIHKQRKMMKTALHFLNEQSHFQNYYCRFDVICFDFHQHFAKTLQQDFSKYPYDQQWIENAFTFDQELINL